VSAENRAHSEGRAQFSYATFASASSSSSDEAVGAHDQLALIGSNVASIAWRQDDIASFARSRLIHARTTEKISSVVSGPSASPSTERRAFETVRAVNYPYSRKKIYCPVLTASF
jgi:hypothetical protein